MRTPLDLRCDLRSDSGQLHIAVAATTAAVLLITAVFLGASSSIDSPNPTACQIQPAASDQATTSIPANYLQLYRKAGQQYAIPWNILAAIGKVESDHGRDPSPGVHSGANSAGAAGPMQIGIGGAATNNWGGTPRHRADAHVGGYGTDGDGDGWDDVYDPADAIPAAAHILKDHGAPTNITKALFAYNHSTDYVGHVLTIANNYSHGAQAVTAAVNPACEQAAINPLPANQVATKVIAYARAQIGKPYQWGGTGPDVYDCSGLTQAAYNAAGIHIPRVAADQWQHLPHIPRGQERPGDLVFFVTDGTFTSPGHVGIVIGNDQMIAAPHTGTVIQIQNGYTTRSDLVGFARPA